MARKFPSDSSTTSKPTGPKGWPFLEGLSRHRISDISFQNRPFREWKYPLLRIWGAMKFKDVPFLFVECLGKLYWFTNLNSSATKGDDFPWKTNDSRARENGVRSFEFTQEFALGAPSVSPGCHRHGQLAPDTSVMMLRGWVSVPRWRGLIST